MKRVLGWAFLPSLIAVVAAAAPVGVSMENASLTSTDAFCMDCTISANHICGGPLGPDGYCTSGSSWCKEPAQE